MVSPKAKHINSALEAGRIFRGHTWPNPSVGCVLVDPATDQIIATGCTQSGGRPHAEIDALTKAGDKAAGTIAYVTLEPCNHISSGKPLSCTDALLNAGVSAVVIGMPDPDARMRGHSIAKIRAAGIPCHTNFGIDAVYHAHAGHCTRVMFHRPRVTLKLAHSRDGKIGLPGQRVNIGGDVSWQRVFLQRSKVDAVLIGINTALADDPQLTDRRKGVTQQPIRIILDTHARLPRASALIQGINTAPVWILCAENADTSALAAAGARIIPCPLIEGKIHLPAALQSLGAIGLTHILAEGGLALATDLIAHDLVDEAIIIEGTADIGPEGIPMPEFDWILTEEKKVGNDLWRYYESKTAAAFRRAFFSDSQKLQPE